jgi:predicted nucleic acid-binding Zn ribbon protein
VRRPAPRPLGLAVEALAAGLEPATPLGAVQRVWPAVVGDAIALEARPTAERGGVVTVSCRAAVWAQELDLMAPDVIERLNGTAAGPLVRSLRCVATGAG